MAYKFFNYAQAMKDKNEIEAGKLKNQLQGLANEETTLKLENLKKVREVREMHKNAPARIQALKDAGMLQEANQLIQSELETLSTGVEVAKQMRSGLNADNWKATRQQLIEVGGIEPEFMPTEYSDSWLRDREKEARANLQKITVLSGDAEGNPVAQDRIYKNGQLSEAGSAYDPRKARSTGNKNDTGKGGITPAMSNSIGRTVAQRFDSVFDENTGEVVITDPTVRPKALGIRTLAEQYVLQGMTPAAAVEKASKEYGYESAPRNSANDPNNLRGYIAP